MVAARPALGPRLSMARAATSLQRPRFFLQLIPSGGMDAVMTTDPKTVRQVSKGIDVPFAAREIIDTKSARLAPMFAALAKWTNKLAIVNGIRQNSANHPAGAVHASCMQTTATPGMPSILDLLGTRRNGEAAGSINLGSVFGSELTPKYLGEVSSAFHTTDDGLMAHLDKADPDDLLSMAKLLDARAKSAASTSPAGSMTVENIRTSAEVLARWGKSPKFVPTWKPVKYEEAMENGPDLQRALWFFENGISRCVSVNIGSMGFDTHLWNTTGQAPACRYVAEVLSSLFSDMEKRMVDGRPLSEQTVVFIGSEIGRFPRLNNARGKDHLPQVPYMFFGPWFRTGAVYGETDQDMISKPVSLATGKPERGGKQLRLDDIGRTLLELDGANPEVFGYTGERLPFLLA
jgi:hypothetical protein